MVPMCCGALTEWNMSAQRQRRQQASCLVIAVLEEEIEEEEEGIRGTSVF